MKKTVAILLTVLMAAGVLNGCSILSGRNDQSSNYGPYVQSLLDVSYKGDAEKYLELVDDTQEAADGYYEDTMGYWAYQVFVDYYQAVVTTDAVEERMMNIMKDIFAKAKYEVGDAVKVEDYHTVQVTIYPLKLTELVDDAVSSYIDEFNAKTDAGEYGDIENDEAAYTAWEEIYANAIMDIIEEKLDQIEYGDPVEKLVKVTTDEDGFYGISEEDQLDLEQYLLE